MMDPRIPLGVNIPQRQSPMNALAKVMELRQMQQQGDLADEQMQQARAERDAMNGLLAKAQGVDMNTPEGQAALLQHDPRRAPALVKPFVEIGEKRAQTRQHEAAAKASEASSIKTAFETKKSQIEFHLQSLAAVNDPRQAAAWVMSGAQAGGLAPEQAQAALAEIPQDPQRFAQWRQAMIRSGMTAAQQLEADYKAQTAAEAARHNRATEGHAAASLAEQRRQFGITEQRLGAAADAPTWDATNQVWVDRKNRTVTPAIGAGGKPLPAGGNITEGERNAGGYASRMVEATKLLDTFEKTGRETYLTRAAGAVPLTGNAVRGEVMDADQQRYRQAAEDWVRAKLRKESGAVINADEMEREIQTYFPMPWDKPETVKQKKQSREVANQAMVAAAGRGFKPTQEGGATGGWSIEPVK